MLRLEWQEGSRVMLAGRDLSVPWGPWTLGNGGMPEWSGGHVRTCSHSCTGAPKVLSGFNNSSPFLSSLHKHTTVREKISSARLPLLLSWRHSLTAADSRADLCPQVVLREARLISPLTVGAEVQEY